MLSALAEKFQQVFKNLRGYGKLTESNIAEALREVRMALLAADVNFQVARDFCERIKGKALGEEVQGSIRPGDLFVKIVHDELIALFSEGSGQISNDRPLNLMVCGLNGAGKTTSAGKLALYFRHQKESVLLVAADLVRPAAVQQLQTLGKQINVPVIAPEAGIKLIDHLKHAQDEAKKQNARVVIYDTAGRLEVNEELLRELHEAFDLIKPQECLLVADAATGQNAVEVAKAFQSKVKLTGILLSKFDGDAKGGAALSLQSVTGCPIKFLGTGEQPSALELFQPERLVSRMLGMGDIIGLVEKAQAEFDIQDAAKLESKIRNQTFDLQDFIDQMCMVRKLGPLQNLLGMIPGMNNLPDSAFDERALKQTEAIVLSMTLEERRNPDVLNARRRQRIAQGSGTTVAQVNDLIRRFTAMKKMMAQFVRGGNMENKLKRMMSRFGA
jgi:signal recognition particle subunit SRP54